MYVIAIGDSTDTKKFVSREGETVTYPNMVDAWDTAQWFRGVYPQFTFEVEEA